MSAAEQAEALTPQNQGSTDPENSFRVEEHLAPFVDQKHFLSVPNELMRAARKRLKKAEAWMFMNIVMESRANHDQGWKTSWRKLGDKFGDSASTARRICQNLRKEGFLQIDINHDKYEGDVGVYLKPCITQSVYDEIAEAPDREPTLRAINGGKSDTTPSQEQNNTPSKNQGEPNQVQNQDASNTKGKPNLQTVKPDGSKDAAAQHSDGRGGMRDIDWDQRLQINQRIQHEFQKAPSLYDRYKQEGEDVEAVMRRLEKEAVFQVTRGVYRDKEMQDAIDGVMWLIENRKLNKPYHYKDPDA